MTPSVISPDRLAVMRKLVAAGVARETVTRTPVPCRWEGGLLERNLAPLSQIKCTRALCTGSHLSTHLGKCRCRSLSVSVVAGSWR